MDGYGNMTFRNGFTCEGYMWSMGRLTGQGTCKWPDDKTYTGI